MLKLLMISLVVVGCDQGHDEIDLRSQAVETIEVKKHSEISPERAQRDRLPLEVMAIDGTKQENQTTILINCRQSSGFSCTKDSIASLQFRIIKAAPSEDEGYFFSLNNSAWDPIYHDFSVEEIPSAPGESTFEVTLVLELLLEPATIGMFSDSELCGMHFIEGFSSPLNDVSVYADRRIYQSSNTSFRLNVALSNTEATESQPFYSLANYQLSAPYFYFVQDFSSLDSLPEFGVQYFSRFKTATMDFYLQGVNPVLGAGENKLLLLAETPLLIQTSRTSVFVEDFHAEGTVVIPNGDLKFSAWVDPIGNSYQGNSQATGLNAMLLQ